MITEQFGSTPNNDWISNLEVVDNPTAFQCVQECCGTPVENHCCKQTEIKNPKIKVPFDTPFDRKNKQYEEKGRTCRIWEFPWEMYPLKNCEQNERLFRSERLPEPIL